MNFFTSTKNEKINRATVLKGLTAFGLTSLSNLFAEKNQAEQIRIKSPVKSVIFLNMAGGMSHVDTLDPKSQSQFGKVSSSIRRCSLGSGFRKTAKELKRISLIRSLTSSQGDHQRAQFLLHTGYDVAAGFPDIPSIGAVIAYAHQKSGPYFPQHITIGGRGNMIGKGGFLGTKFNSYHIGNAERPLSNVEAHRWLSEDRFFRREQLLEMLNKDFAKKVSSKQTQEWNKMHAAAIEFMNSDSLQVFDIKKEKDRTAKRFGNSRIGKALLLAKRLAKAEVPFIEVTIGGWDTHSNNKERISNILKDLDPAVAALLGELGSSGLLKQTLFILSSEFGRTPSMASNGNGRDHYPRAWTTLIGGGNIQARQVIGATDKKGEKVIKDKQTVQDQVATIYKAAGIDHGGELTSSFGRPFPLLGKGTPIKGLI